jgi:hypothetical protein
MSSFVSPSGVWKPAQEKAYDPKTGEIYVGPDRAALAMEKENGGPFGQDATKDPQMIQASRNAGFNSVEEYLKVFSPTPKQVEATEKAQSTLVTHKDPEPKPGVDGGTAGGFYDPNTQTPEEVMATKRRGRPKGS